MGLLILNFRSFLSAARESILPALFDYLFFVLVGSFPNTIVSVRTARMAVPIETIDLVADGDDDVVVLPSDIPDK